MKIVAAASRSACWRWKARATGKPAAIGRLADAEALLSGQAGTLICPTG
jgi:carbamate kinase